MNVSSFSIDHDKLLPGVYVSRKDNVGEEVLTTFDLRMKIPNTEPALDISSIHTLEHLMATYLRSNKEWASKIIYVGPMGCRTGMYLILHGDFMPEDILPLLKDTFSYVVNFSDSVPATTSIECGNHLEHNLAYAKWDARKYLEDVLISIKKENMYYPN